MDQNISVDDHDISFDHYQNISVDHYYPISEHHRNISVEYSQANCQIYVNSSKLNCISKPTTCLILYFSALNKNRLIYIVFCTVTFHQKPSSYLDGSAEYISGSTYHLITIEMYLWNIITLSLRITAIYQWNTHKSIVIFMFTVQD